MIVIFPGVRATPIDLPPTGAKVDLDMIIFRSAAGRDDFDLTLTYRTDLFEAATVARMAAYFERLLVAAVADPVAPIRSLPGPVENILEPPRAAAAAEAPRPDIPMSAHPGVEQDLVPRREALRSAVRSENGSRCDRSGGRCWAATTSAATTSRCARIQGADLGRVRSRRARVARRQAGRVRGSGFVGEG